MERFEKKIWMASPTTHEGGLQYVNEAWESNWISTVGANINEVERITREKLGIGEAVALSSGTAALHLAVKLAGVKPGDKVFCTDMTFAASVNAILYENGEPIFIDTEYDSWNMDPIALEKAFELYPETKVIVVTNLYGTPAKYDAICDIADHYGAILVEDAAESLGAAYMGKQTGTFGKYNIISFNGNKIITGSSGGMLLTDSKLAADKARKWSTQSREAAQWYQHEEIGYNYRMSNVIAGVVRAQYPWLEEHIARKKAIYERYRDGLKSLPVSMNPFDTEKMQPNYWLSCMLIDESAMCRQVRSDDDSCYISEPGKSCPSEILDAFTRCNVEARPIWKPMHLQPMYRMTPFITRNGDGRAATDAYIPSVKLDVGADIFNRGLCLPSDIKMTPDEQDKIIDIVRECFD